MAGNQFHQINLRELFAIGFGSAIGSGWLTVLGFWLISAGSIGATLAFIASCCIVIAIALAYAELGAMYPVTGGEVAYSQFAFGSAAAFWVGWMLILVYIGFVCYLFVSVGWVFGVILPEWRGPILYMAYGEPMYLGELIFGLFCSAMIAWINIRGAKVSASVQHVLTYALIGIAIAFAICALAKGQITHLLQDPFVFRDVGWKYGSMVYVFALILPFYSGFNFVSQAIGERKESISARQAGLVMVVTPLSAMIFYCTILLAAASLLPRKELLGLELPTAGVIQVVFGIDWLGDLVLTIGIVALITTWNGGVFAGARALYTLAELRTVPKLFCKLNRQYHTPIWGILILTIIGTLIGLAGRGAIVPMLNFITVAIAVAWIITSLAAVRLRQTRPQYSRPIRIAFGPLIFSIGALSPSL